MVAPIYDVTPASAHDLTDITLAEATTGFTQWNAGGGGGNIALGAGADFSMQGTNAVDGKIGNTEKGMLYDNGVAITLGADHIYMWLFLATPGLSDTLALRGLCVGIGSGTTANVQFHVEGNATYGAGGRVGKCYIVDYATRTSNLGSIPYRTVNGSPPTNPDFFGVSASITASVKSSNLACDAIRYGTGAYLTGGEAADECTFAGFAAVNDAVANRWGILTGVSGSLELQGKFVIGQNDTGTAAACIFDDANVNVVIVDTVHSAADFSEIIVDHASTTCDWVNVSLTALGTNNKGAFIVNVANPTVNVTSGTWTEIDTTVLRSNSTIIGLTWRGTGIITQNAASITGCTFDKPIGTVAVTSTAATLGSLTENTFVSSGSGYAIDLGTTTDDTSITWNNQAATGVGANEYANSDGTSGDEVIKITYNGVANKTIAVALGATTPTVHNDGTGTILVVASFTLTLTDIPSGVNVTIVNSSTRAELQHSASTGVDITYPHGGGGTVDILLMANTIDPNLSDIYDLVLPSTNSAIKFQTITDSNYANN